MSLANGLSILFILSKNQLLALLTFAMVSFVGILTCILSCKNQIASLCPMQDTACLGLVHGDDPEGCCGEVGGRGVHVWDSMYTRGGFMSMYGKTNTVL